MALPGMQRVESKARVLRLGIIVQPKSGKCRALFDIPHLQILPMQKKHISLDLLLTSNPPLSGECHGNPGYFLNRDERGEMRWRK